MAGQKGTVPLPQPPELQIAPSYGLLVTLGGLMALVLGGDSGTRFCRQGSGRALKCHLSLRTFLEVGCSGS